MPHESRGTREPQSLEAWESWVDSLIREAQDRGDFDDLPGHGKPLQLEDAPLANGLDVGYGVLRNAGAAPMWIELEKEIRAKTARMDELAMRAASLAREQPTPARQAPSASDRRRWWWPFGRERSRTQSDPAPATSRSALAIGQLRREYLELATERERLIGHYNAAIPRDLWQLERSRPDIAAAVKAFDDAVADPGGTGELTPNR